MGKQIISRGTAFTGENRRIYVCGSRSNLEGECRFSIKIIEKDNFMWVSTVKRVIDDLVPYVLLTKEFRCRENGSHTSNLYLLKK